MHLATVVKGEGGRIRGHSGDAVGLGVIGHGCVRNVCCGKKSLMGVVCGVGDARFVVVVCVGYVPVRVFSVGSWVWQRLRAERVLVE